MAKKIIIGNWKMNPKTEGEAMDLVREIVNKLRDIENLSVDLGIAPPFVFMENISDVIFKRHIMLGAQDVHWAEGGSYTGEVSVEELKSLGTEFVIVGHSERRSEGETDEQINKKLRKALADDMKVVLCVGEPKKMRGKGIEVAKRFVSGQLEKDLEETEAVLDKKSELMVAYEPLWAISGNDKAVPAKPNEAVEMTTFIKKFLEINEIGENRVKVLYGGSIDSQNSADFLNREEIDGVLVGRASLDSNEFVKIINKAGIK